MSARWWQEAPVLGSVNEGSDRTPNTEHRTPNTPPPPAALLRLPVAFRVDAAARHAVPDRHPAGRLDSHTRGALIGTPRYMSPEQVQGRRVDGRSDLYAVGIILYELLIGTPPFISGDIAYQQVNIVPTRPREICQTIPIELDRVIMKCLEKNPDERYPDARSLRRALAECYHNQLPHGVTPRSLLREDPGNG